MTLEELGNAYRQMEQHFNNAQAQLYNKLMNTHAASYKPLKLQFKPSYKLHQTKKAWLIQWQNFRSELCYPCEELHR